MVKTSKYLMIMIKRLGLHMIKPQKKC